MELERQSRQCEQQERRDDDDMHADVHRIEAPDVRTVLVALFLELAAQQRNHRALQPEQVVYAEEREYADQQSGHKDPDHVHPEVVFGVRRVVVRIEARERSRYALVALGAGGDQVVGMDARAWIFLAEIPVRRMAVGAVGAGRQAEVARLPMETVSKGPQVVLVASATGLRRPQPRFGQHRLGYAVACVAIDTDWSFFAGLPGQTVSALFLPAFQQQLVTSAAHLRRVGVRHRSIRIVDREDLVTAVAARAARRGDQAGNQQGATVLAGDEILQRRFGRIMTCAALVDLVDRGNPAIAFIDPANRVRVAVAIDACRLFLVDAPADRAQFAAVAVTAAVLIGQRLHATLVALVYDVRMTLTTLDVRVCRGRIFDVFMTSKAILQGLSTGERCKKQKPETEKRFRARDPGRGHIHCPESLCEWL